MTKFKSRGLQQSHSQPQECKDILGNGPGALAHQTALHAKHCVPFWVGGFPYNICTYKHLLHNICHLRVAARPKH